MSRSFALAAFALAVATTLDAAPPAPRTVAPAPVVARVAAPAAESGDTLLSSTTQLYARWDGVTAHSDAYQKSIWGPVMAGPTGDSIRALLAKAPKLVGNSLLADPLLDGKSPTELLLTHESSVAPVRLGNPMLIRPSSVARPLFTTLTVSVAVSPTTIEVGMPTLVKTGGGAAGNT